MENYATISKNVNLDAHEVVNGVELLGYNIGVYKELVDSFNYSNKSSLMHMTSGGKTYIACALMRGNYNNILILTPKNCICDEWQENKYTPSNIKTMTYQSLLYNIEDKIIEEFDLIIYDEFHHIGAFKWQGVVSYLQERFTNAHHLGLSATPIRYLDNVRCMSDEFFDGNLVEGITLLDAISNGVITPPVYVAGGYIFNEEKTKNIITAINRNFMIVPNAKYNKLVRVLNEFFNLEGNIPLIGRIIKKYIDEYRDTSKCLKFIAFTPNVDNANKLEDSMISWFKYAYPEKIVNVYHINSRVDKDELNRSINKFKSISDGNTINIAISIDMISEGVHYPCVDGVFMLRRTMSPNIYYQQIGRCINPKTKDRALIFDFMDNYSGVGNIESNCLRFRDNNAKSFINGLLVSSDTRYDVYRSKETDVFHHDFTISTDDENSDDFSEYLADNYVCIEKEKSSDKKQSMEDELTKIRFVDVSLDIKELLEDINTELTFNIDSTITRLEKRYSEGKSVLIINDDDLLMSLKRRLSRAVSEKGIKLTEKQEKRLKDIGLVFGKGATSDTRLLNIQRTLVLLNRYNSNKDSLTENELRKLNNGKVAIRKALNKGTLPKQLVEELKSYGLVPSKSLDDIRKDNLLKFLEKLKNVGVLTKKEKDSVDSIARNRETLSADCTVLLDAVLTGNTALLDKFKSDCSSKETKDAYWKEIINEIQKEYNEKGFIESEQNLKQCRNILKRYSMHTNGKKELNSFVLDLIENQKIPLHRGVNAFLKMCIEINDAQKDSNLKFENNEKQIKWLNKTKKDLEDGKLGEFEKEALNKYNIIKMLVG